MDIIIVAHFCGGLKKDENSRFTYIARELAKTDDVELITSDFIHTEKRTRSNRQFDFPFKVTVLPEPPYPRNVCLERFASHWALGKNVARYLAERKVPDVIYCAVPSLDIAAAAARYARKHNVRFIVDIQDLWPEAFKMVFNVPVLSDLIFAPMEQMANGIYGQADAIVAVSKTYSDRGLAVNKKCTKASTVFLGTDISVFDENVRTGRKAVTREDKPLLAYCGTLGSSYDLICVFDALKILRDRGETAPQFIVMGSGPRREEFEQYAKKLDLDVVFTGSLPYPDMCATLCQCDITVNPITRGAAGSIINKHADYAACGLPVLNTQECQEYRDLVDEYQMGLNCTNSDAVDLAEKMRVLLADPDLCHRMGENSRRCAMERFDRRQSYREIFACILSGKENT